MRATYSANVTHRLPSSLFAQVVLNKAGQIPNSYALGVFYSCYVRIFSSHTHYNAIFCDLRVLALKFCSSPVTCWDRCLAVHDISVSGYRSPPPTRHRDWHQNCCSAFGQKNTLMSSDSVQDIALYYRQRFYTVQSLSEQNHYEPYRIWLSCFYSP